MLVLLVFAILVFIPIKTKFEGCICNLEAEARIKATFLYFFPITISLFNMRDKPWQFNVRVFGRIRKIKKSTLKKAGNDIHKYVANDIRYNVKFALSLLKYVRMLKLTGGIGIKERADTTAIINGCINGVICPAVMISKIKSAYVCFTPQYNENILRIDLKCIISFSAANIIHEGIRYYLQRRKLNGKHN